MLHMKENDVAQAKVQNSLCPVVFLFVHTAKKKLNNVVYARGFSFSNEEAREGFGQGATRVAQSHGTVNLSNF